MADLEARIAAWRQTLHEQGSPATVIEELEGHLREEVRRQMLAGRPPEQAFALAVDRLGQPAALAAEFAKNAPVAWLPARLALLAAVAWGGWVAGYTAAVVQGPVDLLLGTHVAAVTLGYTLTLLVGGLGLGYLAARPFLAHASQRGRAVLDAAAILTLAAVLLTAVGVLLGGVWSQQMWGSFWSWDPKEVGGLAILLWNTAALPIYARRLGNDLVHLLAPVAGNVVVILGWFGASLVGLGSLHNYSDPGLTAITLAVLAHAAAMSLSLLPPRRPAVSR